MIKKLKKIAMIGILMLAGGAYTESSLKVFPNEKENYKERLTSLLEKQSELFITSDLEKKLKEEKESFIEKTSKPYYLTPDLLNVYIRQAYDNVKKWPDEFDKRLFRLMLKQESQYNVYAISKAGAMSLAQIMPITCENFRPEEYASFRDSATGKFDTLALKKFLFNPVTNLEISLEKLKYDSDLCKKQISGWDTIKLENKRRKILHCYNAGEWVIFAKDKELPIETTNYADSIMAAYHNPKVKVKL